jgi:hypothetical protein
MTTEFKLWLEFELWPEGSYDPEDEFCNIHVELPDGSSYGLNVWTHKYLARSVEDDRESGENLAGRYTLPPDLFVERLGRALIEEVIAELLAQGLLRDDLRSPPEDSSSKQPGAL